VTPREFILTEALLVAKNLTKRFGGLAAVNDISLSLYRNTIHAVIGPNGAGKSTLTNLLSGDIAPTSGTVHLNSKDMTGATPEKISLAGLGRSYQKTNIFLPLSVWHNVHLAAQSRAQHATRWLSNAINFEAAYALSDRAIAQTDLKSKAHTSAATLSHGEQRQLEIAMALATQPQVLLLDEPLAGMGTAEAEKMITLLHTLKKDHAILLVEHDMDAVFALADQLTVMVNGSMIASGLPADIRNNAAVQAAYLGEEHA
jgi:branched-chain amino acid transport system ATP-binding protein